MEDAQGARAPGSKGGLSFANITSPRNTDEMAFVACSSCMSWLQYCACGILPWSAAAPLYTPQDLEDCPRPPRWLFNKGPRASPDCSVAPY